MKANIKQFNGGTSHHVIASGHRVFREGTFLIGGGGGGWAGASEGRVISKMFTNWGGPNLFCSKLGEGHTFFSKEEDYSISLLFKSTLLFYLPSL